MDHNNWEPAIMHNHCVFTLAATLLFASISTRLVAEPPRIQAGLREARKVAAATVEQDAAGIVDLTHPRIIGLIGGRDVLISAAKMGFKELRDQGFTLKEMSVEPATVHGRSEANMFSVFPTISVITDGKRTNRAQSFLLGISGDGGKTWKFVDGSGLGTVKARTLIVPDLPPGLKLPEYKDNFDAE